MSQTEIKWIITPGLKSSIDEFRKIYTNMYTLETIKKKPILIHGDTGVGKSLFYKLFISLSKIEESKIVRFNCATIDSNLIASELFGSEKGAFTGAINRDGLISQADNGVLILEEIGTLNVSDQTRLLTVMEDGKFRKVGGTKEETVNIKIVATTNIDIYDENELRRDIRFRFHCFRVPPLYERRIDVLYYIFFKNRNLLITLAKNEVFALLAYQWPGNLRELNDVINILSLSENRRRIPPEEPFASDEWAQGRFYTQSKTKDLSFWSVNFFIRDMMKLLDGSLDVLTTLGNFIISIGFSDSPQNYAFPKKTTAKILNYKDCDLDIIDQSKNIEKYNDALKNFCMLIQQPITSPCNLLVIEDYQLSLMADKPIEQFIKSYRIFNTYKNNFIGVKNKWKRKYDILINQIMENIYDKMKTNLISDIITTKTIDNDTNTYSIDILKTTQNDLDTITENVYIKQLKYYGGNVSKTARELGIDRSRLVRALKKI